MPNHGSLRGKLARVYRRDRGVCQLCFERVDAPGRKESANPRRASLDHIVPRSRGGSHGMENLRLAHADCNEKRGSPRPRHIGGVIAESWPT